MPDEPIRTEITRILREMGVSDAAVHLERPRDPSFGDAATNVAMGLARKLGRPPRQIAEEIRDRLDFSAAQVSSVDIAGPGFLNFRRSETALGSQLATAISCGDRYGRSETGAGRPVMVEFVSANPTGPLHLGHARQAALGDAIASLLDWTGWRVHREYYYNDAGRQIERLAESVHARYRQRLGLSAEFPADGYMGDYVSEVAAHLEEAEGKALIEPTTESLARVRDFTVAAIRREQDDDLAAFGVRFDEHYLESSLYERGGVDDTLKAIRANGHAFDLDGAAWLRATSFGDQKDRVMVRADGRPTYFIGDVAYHRDKWERGFRDVINVQGADHHGTVARVRAGLQALGLPARYPEYVLHSMIRVVRQGVEVKASKRSGSGVTLREILDEVGRDVARYFFLMTKPDAQMLFDIDRALEHSDKNPVYKVQYAHARLCALFEKGGIDSSEITGKGADGSLLRHSSERELMRAISDFPDTVERVARMRAPHVLCSYLGRAAGAVNAWYHAGHPSRAPELAALVEDIGLRHARLSLARAAQITLANGLDILGVTAPVRM